MKQLASAKISQRTNLLLIPMVFAHWVLGMFSEYEQNMGLYGTFSIVNGVLGALVFLGHCSNNQQVRLSKYKYLPLNSLNFFIISSL